MAFIKNFLQRKQKKISEKNLKEKTVNVLVMGKVAVGKTSLIRRLVDHEEQFSDKHVPTVYDDMVKDVNVEGCKVTFKFMELGGKHPFPTMLEVFIKEAHVYLLVYAADDEESHNALIRLREKIVSVKGKCYTDLSIIVARNKVDFSKRRSRKEKIRRKSVANWCYQHHDISAKTGLKTNAIMDVLIEESKFIGNEIPEETLNCQEVSGRYIYTEKKNTKNPKWVRMFSNQNKRLDRKNARRLGFRRSKNESPASNELFVPSPTQIKRSLSLPSLRHSFRKLRRKNKKDMLPKSASFDLESSAVGTKRRSCTWPETDIEGVQNNEQLSNMKNDSMEERDKGTCEEEQSRTSSIGDDRLKRNDSGLRMSIDSKTKGSVNSSQNTSIDSDTRTSLNSFVREEFNLSFRGSTRRSSSALLDRSNDFQSRRGSGTERNSSTRRKSMFGDTDTSLVKSDSIHNAIKEIDSPRNSIKDERKSFDLDSLPKRSSLYQKRTDFANKKQKSVTLSTGETTGSEKTQTENENRKSFNRKSSAVPIQTKSVSSSASFSSTLSQESGSLPHRRVSSIRKENAPIKKKSSYEENVFFPDSIVLDSVDGPKNHSNDKYSSEQNKENKEPQEKVNDVRADSGTDNELSNNLLKPINRSQIPWMRLKSLSHNNVQNIDNMFTVERPMKFPEKKNSAKFKTTWGSFRCEEKRSSFGLRDTDKNGSLEGSKSSFGQELSKLVAKGRNASFTSKRDAANRIKGSSTESQSNTLSVKSSGRHGLKPPLRKKDSYSLNDIRFIPSRYED